MALSFKLCLVCYLIGILHSLVASDVYSRLFSVFMVL